MAVLLPPPRYLYAVIKGLPIVKADWVLACVKAKQQASGRSGSKAEESVSCCDVVRSAARLACAS